MLTPTQLCSYKEYKQYENPTETIMLADCNTVRSAEEEVGRKFAFVANAHKNPQ